LRAVPTVAAVAITLAFGWLCARFVAQPTLASLADDSVTYLVMAQVFSPWQAASAPVAEAFAREAFYPPLYPLVLALAGVAHDMARAHVVTALLLAACLPLLYFLATRWLGERWGALAALACAALLPTMWIHVKGMLSEPLFSLLLLATLLAADRDDRAKPWLLAVLLAALALTRSVGVVVAAGYAAWALARSGVPLRERIREVLPALAAPLVYLGWVLIRPAADINEGVVSDYAQRFGSVDGLAAFLGMSLVRQALAIFDAWNGALLLFWVQGQPVRLALACAVGILALVGMGRRLAAGRPDPWMVGAYLIMYLLWPFYDQMTRFLFPVVPVLVLYAFWTAGTALRALGRPALLGHGLVALLLVSLALPAIGFIRQRAQAGGPEALITDWYRTPDLTEARRRARVHLDLMEDMSAIAKLTRPEDRVMWVAPAYIALLAERRGAPAPDLAVSVETYRRKVMEADVPYVLLTAYHPRDTIRDTAWRTGTQALAGHGKVVHERSAASGEKSSMLLKLAQ
jgi:hypothetical protein